jgi:ribonuclease III
MAHSVMAGSEAEVLDECQAIIGYRFRKPELLRAALTHTSGANTRLASNERMEFLGDAVLGLVCCDQLYERYPEYQEGDMTKVKSAVVSRRVCARISRKLRLGDFLFMGRGLHAQNEVPPNILADVFESMVAAIYLDGGLEAAKTFILEYLVPEIELAAEGGHGNHKSVLQQVAQRQFGDTPKYRVLDEQGPDHNKCFKVAAEIVKQRYPAAWGINKKEAEQKAAMNALAAIKGEAIPHPADF